MVDEDATPPVPSPQYVQGEAEKRALIDKIIMRLNTGDYLAGIVVFVRPVTDTTQNQRLEYTLLGCDLRGGYNIAAMFQHTTGATIRAELERLEHGKLDG